MKKISLFSVLLGGGMAVMAQPAITHQCNPAAGLQQHLATAGVPPAPGAQGANVTWDFSSVSGTDIEGAFVACPTHRFCSLFPGSDLVLESPADTSGAVAWMVDQGRLAMNGVRVNGINFVYSDPMEILRYPFTFNDSYRDSFVCDFTSGMPFNRRGEITVEADGYGTLILPHATFTNTLRVKTVESYTDFVMGSPMFTYETVSYFWYTPGKQDLLAKHSVVYTLGQQSSENFHYTRTYPTGISNGADISTSLQVFPNPATDLVQLHFTAAAGTNIRVQLFDLTGRPVRESREISAAPGMNEIRLGTDGLASGMYLLRINAGSEAINRKIEIRQ